MGEIKTIEDFLPPKDLVVKDENVKVTRHLAL
jgi:hypothetical protein